MKKQAIPNLLPTVIVILGATGDLMSRKIVPALFYLYCQHKLSPLTKIIGFSRRNISELEFLKMVEDILVHHQSPTHSLAHAQKFLKLFSYHRGNFQDEEEYHLLGKKLGQIDGEWKACSNKLFYLAVPPEQYKSIFQHLASSKLTKSCSDKDGWTRVLVEKPFGHDEKTSQVLDELLGRLFKEEQIYRIDHYLAKEMFQNILSFRFTNNLFEKSWNNQSIEKVEIRLWEKIGVEKRGSFYDGIGALRDVGQNHLLQLMALITMEAPDGLNSTSIRQRRAEVLSGLKTPTKEEVKKFTYRAQHKNYREIVGVNPKSKIETYFKTILFFNSPRWKGVPFILESGKRMGKVQKEIIVTFKHPSPCLCPPETPHLKNKISLMIEPEEGILISFLSKKPSLNYRVEERRFRFYLRHVNERKQYVEEYEKLLFDAIVGDQTLFVSTREVGEMWRVIDPIICAWENDLVPLKVYNADTTESAIDSQSIENIS